MLIVEGGDLVGKSTLVKHWSQTLDAANNPHMPHHLTKPPANWDYLFGYTDICSVRSIWDRFHLSCLMYRQLDDHPCKMTPLMYGLIDATITLHAGYVVVITAEDDVIRQRYAADPHRENMYPLEHALQVNRAFLDAAKSGVVHCRNEVYRPKIDDHIHIRHASYDVSAYDRHLSEYTFTLARFREINGHHADYTQEGRILPFRF